MLLFSVPKLAIGAAFQAALDAEAPDIHVLADGASGGWLMRVGGLFDSAADAALAKSLSEVGAEPIDH